MAGFATIASRLGDLASGFMAGQKEREQEINTQNIQSLQLGLQLGTSGLDPNVAKGLVNYDRNPGASTFFQTGATAGQAAFTRSQDALKAANAFKMAELGIKQREVLLRERGIDVDRELGLLRIGTDRDIAGFNANNAWNIANLRERGDNMRTEATLSNRLTLGEMEATTQMEVQRLRGRVAEVVGPNELPKIEGVVNSRLTTMTDGNGNPIFTERDFERDSKGGYTLNREGMLKRDRLVGTFYELASARGARTAEEYMRVADDFTRTGGVQFAANGMPSLHWTQKMPAQMTGSSFEREVVSRAAMETPAQRAETIQRLQRLPGLTSERRQSIIAAIQNLERQ